MSHRSFTEKQETNVVKLYNTGSGSNTLAAQFGVSNVTILNLLRRHSVPIRGSRRISKRQELEIIKQYKGGRSCLRIGADYGISDVHVLRILKKHNVTTRTITEACTLECNHRAFAKITPDSAYWAGFLMADGCIGQRDGMSATVTLGLSMTDISHVLKYRKFLKAHQKIGESPARWMVACGRRVYSKGVARISIASNELAADLARFGVIPCKSLTAMVKGGLEYNRHFWRGVVDGDGHIVLGGYNKRVPRVGLTGSKVLCNQFLAYVKTIYKGRVVATVKSRANNEASSVTFGGETARAILKKLYLNAPTVLDRKLETALEIMYFEAKSETTLGTRISASMHAYHVRRAKLE